ncbi:MAG TPA: methyltransferase domain-containing protein [Polyangiaceae bacterium]|nr:methyltransferase domain-containing protein [Polyangiaceae bacterium]
MLIVDSDVQHVSADFDLDPLVLQALWRMEETHFWHAARNRWIARALRAYGALPPARVLEVGCGGGAVARMLGTRGYSVVGVDTAEVLVRKAHSRLPAGTFVASSVEKLDPGLGPFDVVAFFDVLEHLEQPGTLLRGALEHARPGALVIASVPALKHLYSAIDSLAGHKRRYELGELEQTFAEVGLRDIAAHGIFRLLLPVLSMRRTETRVPSELEARRRLLLDDMRTPPYPLNQTLRLACALEARLGFERSRGKPGPSLIVVGRVPR